MTCICFLLPAAFLRFTSSLLSWSNLQTLEEPKLLRVELNLVRFSLNLQAAGKSGTLATPQIQPTPPLVQLTFLIFICSDLLFSYFQKDCFYSFLGARVQNVSARQHSGCPAGPEDSERSDSSDGREREARLHTAMDSEWPNAGRLDRVGDRASIELQRNSLVNHQALPPIK